MIDLSRRQWLKAAIAAPAVLSLTVAVPTTRAAIGSATSPSVRSDRLRRAYDARVEAARRSLLDTRFVPNRDNGDERRYESQFGSFTKGLPHDEFGEVDIEAYRALVAALEDHGDFSGVWLGGDRRLANPEAAFSYNVSGPDGHDVYMPPPPTVDSAETAAEMVELYWQALLRDVPFEGFADHPLAKRAAAELSELSGFRGPTVGGRVTPETLFRGTLAGDLEGPYVSQFLYQHLPAALPGAGNYRRQRVRVARAGRDYMTDYDGWLAIQNGSRPAVPESLGPRRHILTPRDLASYVHRDVPHGAYEGAALLMLDMGVPLDSGAPYYEDQVQWGFVDYGVPDVFSAVGDVTREVLHPVWHQKWQVHRRLRPETLGGRLHLTRTGRRSYPLHDDLLTGEAVERTYRRYGTYLLPQAYPEGSPTHPSYPAGHAGIAGACVTVLKAFFDTDRAIPRPVAPNADGREVEPIDADLTVEGELNKLASNMFLGRNHGGIHFASDGTDGVRHGERFALLWLRDRLAMPAAQGSFTLRTFDGRRVRVDAERVTDLERGRAYVDPETGRPLAG